MNDSAKRWRRSAIFFAIVAMFQSAMLIITVASHNSSATAFTDNYAALNSDYDKCIKGWKDTIDDLNRLSAAVSEATK